MKNVWYRVSEGNWYATLRENGRRRQVLLVKAPNTREGKKLAEDQLLEELSARKYQDDGPATHSWMLVSHVIDGFLKHSQEEHDPGTYAWYKNFLDSFKAKWGTLRITLLKKNHVQVWLKDKRYNPTSQNRAISAIKRAFNWAVEEEHIAKSPVAHLRKPKALVRDRILTPDERHLILTSIKDEAFRDFVQGMTLTGCRPGEVARVNREIAKLDAGAFRTRSIT
jgi:integrase